MRHGIRKANGAKHKTALDMRRGISIIMYCFDMGLSPAKEPYSMSSNNEEGGSTDKDLLEFSPENYRQLAEEILVNQAELENDIRDLEKWVMKLDKSVNDMARVQKLILDFLMSGNREDEENLTRLEQMARDVPPHY